MKATAPDAAIRLALVGKQVRLVTELASDLDAALCSAEQSACPDDLSSHMPARGGLVLPDGATTVSE